MSVIDALNLPDRRALAFPDKPFSAYCKVCWNAVYILWLDRENDPNGECPNGCVNPEKCGDANAAAFNKGQVARANRDAEKTKEKDNDSN